LAWSHVVHVLGHRTIGVSLHEQIDEADSVLIADRSVRPDRRLRVLGSLVFRDERACDVETRDGVLLIQLKAELLRVVVDLRDRVQRQGDEALVATGEALDGAITGLGGNIGLFLS